MVSDEEMAVRLADWKEKLGTGRLEISKPQRKPQRSLERTMAKLVRDERRALRQQEQKENYILLRAAALRRRKQAYLICKEAKAQDAAAQELARRTSLLNLKHSSLSNREWQAVRELLIELQNGHCSICKREFSKEVRPALDHCHETDNIRELLCQFCNTGLGSFGDSIARLENAVEYLLKHIKKASSRAA